MSRRQHERTSRFSDEIGALARSASLAFRDEDPDGSMTIIYAAWWNSGLRGRTFTRLLMDATAITKQRISTGAIRAGIPGHRAAMPYFLAVLTQLIDDADRRPRSSPATPRFAGAVTSKTNQLMDLVIVCGFDRFLQSSNNRNAVFALERIVDPARPAVLLKSRKQAALIHGRLMKLLDYYSADSEPLPILRVTRGGRDRHGFGVVLDQRIEVALDDALEALPVAHRRLRGRYRRGRCQQQRARQYANRRGHGVPLLVVISGSRAGTAMVTERRRLAAVRRLSADAARTSRG